MQEQRPKLGLLSELIRDLINEKKKERRSKNIRFFSGFILIIALIWFFIQGNSPSVQNGGKGYVALLRLQGMISQGEGFSAETVLPILKNMFMDKKAKGIVLVIDSGGGTPVQASIIHDAIISLKNRYHKKIVVVGEDLLASGAYYVSVAADKIYVNPNTITGSIGVIMKGFGFTDAIKKVGIKRRVFTAGINKNRLDPFLPQSKEDVAKISEVINEVHQNFIDAVESGRKHKLHASAKILFSGDFWSGKTALRLGLVDGLGNFSDVMQKEFNVSGFKDYTEGTSFLKNMIGQFGMEFDKAFTKSAWHLVEILP